MQLDDQKIQEILLKENYVKSEDLKRAENLTKTKHLSLVEVLLSESIVNREILGQAIGEYLNIPYINLTNQEIIQANINKIPEKNALEWHSVIIKDNDQEIEIATDIPSESLLTNLQTYFPQKKIILKYALADDINQILVRYRKPLETRFAKIIAEQHKVAPEIINEIFNDALDFKASDIHFEPQGETTEVRFRIDGVLQEAGRIEKQYYDNIVNRIKVQAHLRTDEHFAAQDGSIRYEIENQIVDMRVSIVPTLEGETIVIRLLAQYISGFNMEDIGLSSAYQAVFQRSFDKPFGMIIIAGPTGSGKTTTLYTVLKKLNQPGVNITTIEDPVEYRITTVNQIQVNDQTNLTFAKGLRSIVRQDPDIILVGEIRDQETAEIAVNAALTGHLLLSTFHANDAATVIPRLLDMGVEPFLLASTLELIVSQRLVRKICEKCRHSIPVDMAKIKQKHGEKVTKYFAAIKTLYQGSGCEACNHTGFRGRTAIFEFIEITPTIEEITLKNPPSQQIWALARENGSISLFEDGVEKVKNGLTTLDELLRVAAMPDESNEQK